VKKLPALNFLPQWAITVVPFGRIQRPARMHEPSPAGSFIPIVNAGEE
jgi:hypothetical protein